MPDYLQTEKKKKKMAPVPTLKISTFRHCDQFRFYFEVYCCKTTFLFPVGGVVFFFFYCY